MLRIIQNKTLYIFIIIILFVAYFYNYVLDPRERFKGNRDNFSFKQEIKNNTYLEAFKIDIDLFLFKIPSDSFSYYLTDSSNYRIYLGFHTEKGYMKREHDSTKIKISIYNPGNLMYDTKDTYYFKDLKKLNNYND